MSAVLEQPAVADTPESLRIELPVNGEFLSRIKPAGAVAVAAAYEIDSAEMAQLAANERSAWAKRIDAIKAMRKDFVEPAQTILERAKKWFNPPILDLEAGRELLGRKLLAWDEQERQRVAREQAEREALARKLRQEAEAKAAAEIARAEEQRREHMRREAEAFQAKQKAHAEGNAKAAAAAAAAEAKAREAAQAALENGHAKAAQVQVAAAAASSSHPPVQEVVKIAGQSTKENWVSVLKDGETAESALEKIVAEIAGVPTITGRRDLLALLLVDDAARGPLNRLAAAQKTHMRVPGYVAKNVPVIAGARK